MFRLFKRASGSDASPAATEAPSADFRACCRAIHGAYLDAEEGRIGREAFLDRKVRLLRAAVRDAERSGQGGELVQVMETLRLTCAVNDVEVESVRAHFAG